MKHLAFIIISILIFNNRLIAQNDSDVKGPEQGKIYFAPLPVLMANPSFGFMYGVAASTSVFTGDPSNTRMSTSLGSLTYSTKKQFMFTFKSNVYLPEDNWVLLGDWRYFDTSQPTFGLGTGPQSAKLAPGSGIEYEGGMFSDPVPGAQLAEFKYIRFHETVFKKLKEYIYAGIGYHYDYHFNIVDNLLDLEAIPPVITSHYAYSIDKGFDPEKYILSGISLNGMYDSRDNAANPYEGRYALV
ncbi:MAG: hypothetical protein ABFS32_16290, partial [Bacteroidota bacterium]